MKKLRNLIALFAVFSMAAVFTGCGDDDDGGNNNQNQGPQFAPADNQTFQAQSYTVTINGQQAQLTFPTAGTYSLQMPGAGAAETGTITGLTRDGETYRATLTPSNDQGALRAGAMEATFTQRTQNTYTGTLRVQTAQGSQTYPFTAMANTGGTNSGTTNSGTTNSGTTNSGTTNSGTTNSGTTNSGTTNSGTTNSGTTNSGTTNSGTTNSGTTNSGTTNSGQTGEIPADLTGKRLQLTYGQFGELFLFTSGNTAVFEPNQQGQGVAVTYNWDLTNRRVTATRQDNNANYNITLTFANGSNSNGTAVVIYQEPNSTATTDNATFTLQ